MSKNYFTKEQALKIALNTNVPFSSDDTQHIFNTAQIREMMNLAVEVAIGEPVAYCRSDTALDWKGQSINIATMFPSPKGLSNPIPLYSVKELEN